MNKFDKCQELAKRYDEIKRYIRVSYLADFCKCSQSAIRNVLYQGFTISDERLKLLESAIENAEKLFE